MVVPYEICREFYTRRNNQMNIYVAENNSGGARRLSIQRSQRSLNSAWVQ
jgi:hypothetical protein